MIHITDPDEDLKKAFDRVESVGFFARQMADFARDSEQFKQLTIGRALEDFIEYGDLDSDDASMMGVIIYGDGGWHRYFLTYQGEIVYSGHHGRSDIEKAETAGFRVLH